MADPQHLPLNIIDINFLPISTLITLIIPILIELKPDALVALVTVCIRLVDLRVLGQLAIRFEGPSFVGSVFEDNVAFFVLVIAEGEKDDVALVDPDFLSQLASDVSEAPGSVETLRFETAVA